MQNTTHAVMAQRVEPRNSRDDFPTPPWATRALLEHVLTKSDWTGRTCMEPACGAGHMAKVLKEYFPQVSASDAYGYGYGSIRDFLRHPLETDSVDWIVTNPPFRLSEEFVARALRVASRGVAILARTTFIESVGRYRNLFSSHPPMVFAQFSERVPMVKGRLDRHASTATSYGWLVWRLSDTCSQTRLQWIPPCRKVFEQNADYPAESSRSSRR
jgi:hypothetical protein